MNKIQLLHGLQDACSFLYSNRKIIEDWNVLNLDSFLSELLQVFDSAGQDIRLELFNLGSDVH